MKFIHKRLILFSILYVLSAGIGTALGVHQNLAAEFGGLLHGQGVWKDFLIGTGTALSPPLILLVAQVLFMVLLTLRDGFERLGAGGLLVLGAMYFIGQLGEPILWRNLAPGGFHLDQALACAANLILPALMFFEGIRAMRISIRQSGGAPE